MCDTNKKGYTEATIEMIQNAFACVKNGTYQGYMTVCLCLCVFFETFGLFCFVHTKQNEQCQKKK